MSSVFSKLIDRTSVRYGIRQETLTHGIAGAAVTLYLLKLGYPYVAARIKQTFTQQQRPQCQRNKQTARSSECCKKRDDNGTVSHCTDANADDDAIALLENAAGNDGEQRPSVGLDRAFLRQLLMLLKIMVPGWRSREAGLLACATLTLLARTFLSVYVAELEGQIVKRIVLRDVHGFSHMLARWFAIALPATFVNSAIRYLEGRLALSFRYAYFVHHTLLFLLFLSFLHCSITLVLIFFLFLIFERGSLLKGKQTYIYLKLGSKKKKGRD